MIIDCISDLHGSFPELEGGDLLIIAGDLTARNTPIEYQTFKAWLLGQDYRKKIVIAGNHDGYLEDPPGHLWVMPGLEYLCDSGTEYEGLKIWGSPWTPAFGYWHFMKDRGLDIKQKWDLIPDDTDILITHGPPYGRLDETVDGELVGCRDLCAALRRVQPRLHAFGHIHEGYGRLDLKGDNHDVTLVNCSIMDENYKSVNKPMRIELNV